ncbi:MAG: fibronectin type III domain-containing protein [Chitinivibrionales bacterium]|nr:fibronectin type III domain-containing protein [Chitinivibrionales bacterium]
MRSFRSVLLITMTALFAVWAAPVQKPRAAAKTTPAAAAAKQKAAARAKALAAMNPYVQDSASLAKKDLPLHAHIAVIAKALGDSVVIRWAPSKPGGWLYGNKNGYIVERYIIADKIPSSKLIFEKLNAQPLKPLTLEDWKKSSKPEDHLAAIAAQVLYGKQMVTKTAYPNDLAYIKFASEELENRWGFALFTADNSAHVAEGLGLRFVDHSVKPGQKIVYRVFAAPGDTSYHLDTGATMVEVRAPGPIEGPGNCVADGGDGRIMLTWSTSMPEHFSGYYVERSADNGKTFHRLTSVPLVNVRNHLSKDDNMTYTDTNIIDYHHYRYRLYGITPFAETSAPIEIEAFGRDLTPPPPPHVGKPRRIAERKVKLTWEMPNKPPDLKGFIITRSENPVRFFHPLMEKALPRDAREFIDTAASFEEPYYIVSSIDTAGNVAPSLPLYVVFRDSTPPAPPTGLAGLIDTLGVVRLHWHANSDSARVLGYRLMWANDRRHEFSQVTSEVVRDTSYVDTVSVKTLTRSVFFKLVALNKWYVPSKPSAVLEIKRPHLIKPVAPLITSVSVTDSTVRLGWARSPSDMIDRQYIERKAPADTGWLAVAVLAPRDSSWTDHNVARTITYEYRIFVHDSGGLSSPRSPAMRGRPYDPGLLAPVSGLNAVYKKESRAVELHWNGALAGKDTWFVVYRSVGQAPPSEYKAVDSARTEFVDTGVPAGVQLRYAVRCQARSGAKSPMSTVVTVETR